MRNVEKMAERVAKALGFRVANVKRKCWGFETFWRRHWRDNDGPWHEDEVPVTVNFNDCVGSVFPSAKELLEMFLEAKTLWWSTGPFSEKSIENPLFNTVFSEEALKVKLLLFEGK